MAIAADRAPIRVSPDSDACNATSQPASCPKRQQSHRIAPARCGCGSVTAKKDFRNLAMMQLFFIWDFFRGTREVLTMAFFFFTNESPRLVSVLSIWPNL